jgi:thymidylate kinase
MAEAGLAPMFAIVGSDGAGKSTVADAVIERLRAFGPARICHLGLQSGDLGRAIARAPLIGGALDRLLTRKAGRARDSKDRIPDAATAIVIYLFSLRRVRRFRKMLALRRRGVIILADRYPQLAVPGFFDGPGLSAARAEGGFVRMLARRERRLYEWMASFVPDIVIRLNVDLETAFARKPDHRYESLRQKIEAVPKLAYNGAPILDLSSLDPLPQVIAQARAGIERVLEEKGYRAAPAA